MHINDQMAGQLYYTERKVMVVVPMVKCMRFQTRAYIHHNSHWVASSRRDAKLNLVVIWEDPKITPLKNDKL